MLVVKPFSAPIRRISFGVDATEEPGLEAGPARRRGAGGAGRARGGRRAGQGRRRAGGRLAELAALLLPGRSRSCSSRSRATRSSATRRIGRGGPRSSTIRSRGSASRSISEYRTGPRTSRAGSSTSSMPSPAPARLRLLSAAFFDRQAALYEALLMRGSAAGEFDLRATADRSRPRDRRARGRARTSGRHRPSGDRPRERGADAAAVRGTGHRDRPRADRAIDSLRRSGADGGGRRRRSRELHAFVLDRAPAQHRDVVGVVLLQAPGRPRALLGQLVERAEDVAGLEVEDRVSSTSGPGARGVQ